MTTAAETKKRKGVAVPKVITKRWKAMVSSAAASSDASAATSTNVGEEVAKNVGGGSGSVAARMGANALLPP